MNYDIVIRNGKIVDGAGSPWFHGDVAIKGGKIIHVGKMSARKADEVIDAKGLIVSPGIVDIHSHCDYSVLQNPKMDSFIRQGITTVLNGNCGGSAAPISEKTRNYFEDTNCIKFDWLSMADYLCKIEENGVAVNVATCTGLTNLLMMTMGYDAWDRPPNRGEVKAMAKILAQSMKEGSMGLSSGLEYEPQTKITTKELIELCKIVSKQDGLYATHIRSRDEQVEASAHEAIEIGEKSGVRVEGVHWGARFPSDGKAKLIVDQVVEARQRGVDIGIDQVPWTMSEDGVGWCGCSMIEPIANGSKYTLKGKSITADMLKDPEVINYLKQDLHNRQYGPILAAKRGLFDSWDRFLLAHCEKSPQYNGMNMKQIAQKTGREPFDALVDLLVKEGENFGLAWGAVGITSLLDTECSLLHPLCAVAIDSDNNSLEGPLSESPIGESTTRAFGQYPYFFRRWVIDKQVLGLEEAVRKCTGLPAQRMRLMDRGLIRPGMWADIMIWNLKDIRDNSTWAKPRAYPSGINWVLVNGAVVVKENEHSGELRGKVIRA